MIEKNGLDPHAFRWDETRPFSHRPHPADLLLYWPSGKPETPEVFFAFGRDRVARSPGSERLYEERSAGDWREQTLPYVALWLDDIKREAGPSLWENFPLESLTPVPEGRFAPPEQAVLLTRLNELEQRLTALNSLTPEQRKQLKEEVRRIANAASRLDKAEWLRFALGCILTVVVTAGIPQGVGASLMRFALSAFHGMVAPKTQYIPGGQAWQRASLR
ncbi:MAG TPA: hypothetical protein VFL28_15470 [bacterium]|nr:hypothetical protein [bacterium]